MAGIYAADIYCDDCIEDVKKRICTELWAGSKFDGGNGEFTPDGQVEIKDFDSREDLEDYLDRMDEHDYDSGAFPKYCPDDTESDGPQHCGSHDDCLDPTELNDGTKVSHFFGNSLTSYGGDYVKEMVNAGRIEGGNGALYDLWEECYDYLDFIQQCANCGGYEDLDDEDHCDECGEFFNGEGNA